MTRRRWILIPVVILLSVFMCCTACFFAALAYEIRQEGSETVLKTEVPLQPGQLPMESTVEEWYDLAVQMLEEQGWDLSPNLVEFSVHLVCSPLPQKPTLRGLYIFFHDAYFDGTMPSTKSAYMSFKPSIDAVSIEITNYPLRWHRKHLELDAIKVGWRDALRIAQQHGGDSFQARVQNLCRVGLSLDDHRWSVKYSTGGDDLPYSAGPTIRIDGRTGEVLENP